MESPPRRNWHLSLRPFFFSLPDYDSSSLLPLSYQDVGGVPLPTLYNGHVSGSSSSSGGGIVVSAGAASVDGSGGRLGGRRMGAIEFLLYNMASMLASVAAGYDIRLSNVQPMHPRLHPSRYVCGRNPSGGDRSSAFSLT